MSAASSSPTTRRICCRPICASCKGVVDSEDLPLNISREMLQHNPMLAQDAKPDREARARRAGEEGQGRAEEYAKFWDNLGVVLKEGLYEDYENRDALVPLVRFRSTAVGGLSLARRLCRRG